MGYLMRKEDLKPVEIYEPVRKIIRSWPSEVRQELGAVLIRLQRDEFVGMPDVRAMPSISKGVFEIRLKSKEGAYRVFYVAVSVRGLLVFHAFLKKSEQTTKKELDSAKSRLKSFIRE